MHCKTPSGFACQLLVAVMCNFVWGGKNTRMSAPARSTQTSMQWRKHFRRTAARRATLMAAWALVCVAISLKAIPMLVLHVQQRDQELTMARGAQALLSIVLVRFFTGPVTHAPCQPIWAPPDQTLIGR